MQQMPAAFAPSEERTAAIETIRGDLLPLRTAVGFVLGGTICLVFWAVLAVVCYVAG